MSTAPFGAVVLAGGKSRRMGSPKHTCVLPSGMTMGAHMVALGKAVADLVVVAGPVESVHDGTMGDIEIMPDLRGHVGLGPLAGIEAALASGRAKRWLVLPCDMPHLTTALVTALRDHPTNGAVVLQGAGPLPLRIDSTLLTTVTAAIEAGALAVRHLQCVRAAAEVPVPNPALIQDVDSPADLR